MISSLTPVEYMSAQSIKLMPASRAWRMTGRASSSSRTHSRHFLEPKLIAPRHSRDTFIPVEPKRTYSMAALRRAHAFRLIGAGNSRLRRRQPRDRNAVRRARNVVHAHAIAIFDRARLAAVL